MQWGILIWLDKILFQEGLRKRYVNSKEWIKVYGRMSDAKLAVTFYQNSMQRGTDFPSVLDHSSKKKPIPFLNG